MPELPEVETIRQDLAPRVAGRCFTGVDLVWPGCVDRPSPEEFARALPGRCIAAVERRGKYLVFRLDQSHKGDGGTHISEGDILELTERRAVNDPASVKQSTLKGAPGGLPTERAPHRPALHTSRRLKPPAVAATQDSGLRTQDLGLPASYLAVHLRMTGRLRWLPAGSERHQHLRAVLTLDDGHELQFEDQRKFGRLYLVPDAAALAQVLAKVGPEPLEGVSREEFHQLLRRRRAQLKPLLLDQRFLAGLGNIYVDEALYRAKLHPLRRSDTLSPEEIERLYDGIVAALRQGIDNRGTTLSNYRDAWGTAGRNQERLLVFRQEGKPCPTCGTPIAKTRIGGRGTHFCPTCQPPS